MTNVSKMPHLRNPQLVKILCCKQSSCLKVCTASHFSVPDNESYIHCIVCFYMFFAPCHAVDSQLLEYVFHSLVQYDIHTTYDTPKNNKEHNPRIRNSKAITNGKWHKFEII